MKLLVSSLTLLLLTSTAFAQDTNNLFPELQGKFQQVKKAETPTVAETEEQVENKIQPQEATSNAQFGKSLSNAPSEAAEEPLTQSNMVAMSEEDVKGSLILTLENVKGVIPYAKNYSYCYGDAVLKNDTTQELKNLAVKLNYGGMNTDLTYSGIKKKDKQSQQIMLIGQEPCESILSVPQIEINACKLGQMPENSCKRKFRFVPPQAQ